MQLSSLFNFRQHFSLKNNHIHRPALNYAGPALADVMNDVAPILKKEPCSYVVIDDFFKPEFYEKLSADFQKILDRGFSDVKEKALFSKFPKYDAYGYTQSPFEHSAVNIMRTQEWRNYFSKIFDRVTTNDEIMAYHHHMPGSKDGWAHNDYSLCSFVEEPLSNAMNPWFYNCSYEDSSSDKQPHTKKVMRAITIIYYLNNEGSGEYGGETALYSDPKTIVEKVKPINNRLFAFEVSPKSIHAFQENRKYPRNTITQWFHSDPEQTFKRFSDSNFVPW